MRASVSDWFTLSENWSSLNRPRVERFLAKMQPCQFPARRRPRNRERRDAGEVQTDQQYSAAEMERMMKLQDVLLKAMAGRLEEHSSNGLMDRRKGKPSTTGFIDK